MHDTLAMKICNEILADPTAPDVRIYARALNFLELSSSSTENLLVLLDEIQEVVYKNMVLTFLIISSLIF